MRAIDTRHGGLDKVICCWQVDGVLVDPGPESTLDTVLEALGDEDQAGDGKGCELGSHAGLT